MLRLSVFSVLAASALSPLVSAASSQSYTWNNVKIGGGGGQSLSRIPAIDQPLTLFLCAGFVPSIVFNPSQKGLAFARTDIGGAYKLNADDSWTPLLDFADDARWNYWGVDALATDPVDPKRLYLVRYQHGFTLLSLMHDYRLLACTPTAGTQTTAKS